MYSSPFDWPKLIAGITDESFGVPPDVTFQIVEEREGKRSLHEVKAHKMILAMVSDTFKTMFYATNVGDKNANIVRIEKTTAPAFTIMLDGVYNLESIGNSLKGKSVHEVFDVVNLLERYQISQLMEEAREYLSHYYPVTEDSVLEVAGDVMEYTKIFKVEAQKLLRICAKVLKKKLKTVDSMIRYIAKNKGEVLSVLLDLMGDMIGSECRNCKKEMCQDGLEVKQEEFREGLVVTNNKDCIYWDEELDYGIGRVTRVEAEDVVVECIYSGPTDEFRPATFFDEQPSWPKSCNDDDDSSCPVFLFSCK